MTRNSVLGIGVCVWHVSKTGQKNAISWRYIGAK